MPDSHTIAENLTRLATARTDIASAITTKGGTVATGAGFEDFPTAIGTIPSGGGSSTLVEKTITANGTYNPADDNADGYSSVTANVSNTYTAGDEGKVVDNGALVSQTAYPSTVTQNGTYDTTLNNSVVVDVPPIGVVVEKDVNFYDYDGTLVYSYTAQEFLALSEMPANPTHEGLTAQGWNWTLADAQAWVTKYSAYVKLDIGQLYVTSDDKIRIVCEFTDGLLNPYFRYKASVDNCVIDWGDGTTSTVNAAPYGNILHTYNRAGRYTITYDANMQFIQNVHSSRNQIVYDGTNVGNNTGTNIILSDAYTNCIKEIYTNSSYAYYPISLYCWGLEKIAVSKTSGVTGARGSHLKCLVPSQHLTITITDDKFIKTICYTADIGANGLKNTPYNKPIVISSLSATHALDGSMIPYVYYDYVIVREYFSSNSRLERIQLSEKVSTIDTRAFDDSQYLSYIEIGANVTSINGYAFNGCTSLTSIKFLGSTPPTVANANAWNNVPTTCKIYVPTGSLSAYTSASNYPDLNTYTYVEY